MKKYIFILIIFIGLKNVSSLNAQRKNINDKKFTIAASAGYNFGLDGNNSQSGFFPLQSLKFEIINITPPVYQVSNNDYNLMKGLNYNLNIGYKLNDYLEANMGFGYIKGDVFEFNFPAAVLIGSDISGSIKSKMFQFKPSLILSSGYETLNPYIKLGLVIGSTSIEQKLKAVGATDVQNATFLTDGNLAIGYNGALGIDFNVGGSAVLFADVNFLNMSYSPEKSKITESFKNGVDVLKDVTPEGGQIEYVDNYTTVNINTPNLPKKEPKVTYNFNTVGINLGVKFGF